MAGNFFSKLGKTSCQFTDVCSGVSGVIRLKGTGCESLSMASSGSNTSSSSNIGTSSGSSMRKQGTPSGVSLAKKRRAAAAAKSTKVNYMNCR